MVEIMFDYLGSYSSWEDTKISLNRPELKGVKFHVVSSLDEEL